MKKTSWIVLLIVFSLMVFGCARGNRYLPPEGEKITTASDTTGCKFIKNVYFEARGQTLVHYAQLNTYNAGGDTYKIVSNTQERVMGTTIHMVNIEVWKCKKDQ
jgi:hypothetical protein